MIWKQYLQSEAQCEERERERERARNSIIISKKHLQK
jgi:hypothetical protein